MNGPLCADKNMNAKILKIVPPKISHYTIIAALLPLSYRASAIWRGMLDKDDDPQPPNLNTIFS